jgi:hypothetical protein
MDLNISYDILMKIFSKNIHKNIAIFAGSSRTGYSNPNLMAMSRSGTPDSFASTRAGNLLPEIPMARLHFNLRMVFFFPHDVFLFSLVYIRTFRYPFSLILYLMYPYDHSAVIIISALYITPQIIRHHNVQSIDNRLYCLIYCKRHFSDKV